MYRGNGLIFVGCDSLNCSQLDFLLGSGASAPEPRSERMDFGVRGIGGELKLFPPPLYHGELENWSIGPGT